MPTLPWKRFVEPVPDREYLALISYLPLLHYRALPKFLLFALETQRQLKTSPGLIGYAMKATPWSLKAWTISVWENQQSLDNFVRQVPHSTIMQALAPHMGKTQFAQWPVTAREIPLDWRSAKARLHRS